MATAGAVDATQDMRLLAVQTPLGKDVLLVNGLSAAERMSGLFTVDVDLLALHKNAAKVQADKLLGQPVSVRVTIGDDPKQGKFRYFHGIVSRFAEGERDRRFVHYQAELVPWTWLLTQTSDCRVFQDKSVLDIVQEVFNELKQSFSFVSFDPKTSRSYTPMDYCVQYRETDFSFVSRLLEQDGIYYYFEHSQNGHKLILADSPSAHAACPHQGTVKYSPQAGAGTWSEETITSWRSEKSLRPGKYVMRDYHFQMPKKDLEASQPTSISVGGNGKLEMFDFPGEYAQRFNKPDQRLDKVEQEGRALDKLRMEEEEIQHAVVTGASACRGFVPGYTFALTAESGKGTAKHLLTSVQHSAVQSPDYISDETATATPYHNTFTCVPHSVPYRQPRLTPKPVVEGLQPAVVVGKQGEEIWIDKYGRVRVQFPWDRQGKKDEKSTCWVRVAQQWAGKRWGMVFWPRIGQEVLVGFMEGDPDQPVIVGSLYNADQMPPYVGDGPDDKHPHDPNLSGIKTNTTKGGQGFNELRFDDTKDKQQVFVHAERNMDVRVKNDSLERIHGHRHQIIGDDKNGQKEGDQRELVYQDKHLHVNRHQQEQIEGNYQLLVGHGTSQEGGNLDVVVAQNKAERVEKDSHLYIMGARNEKVDKVYSLMAQGRQEKIDQNFFLTAGQNVHIKAGTSLVLEAGTAISLKVGGNFVTLSAVGVAINGTLVLINSGGAALPAIDAIPMPPQMAKDAKPTKPDMADDAKTGSKSS